MLLKYHTQRSRTFYLGYFFMIFRIRTVINKNNKTLFFDLK